MAKAFKSLNGRIVKSLLGVRKRRKIYPILTQSVLDSTMSTENKDKIPACPFAAARSATCNAKIIYDPRTASSAPIQSVPLPLLVPPTLYDREKESLANQSATAKETLSPSLSLSLYLSISSSTSTTSRVILTRPLTSQRHLLKQTTRRRAPLNDLSSSSPSKKTKKKKKKKNLTRYLWVPLQQ